MEEYVFHLIKCPVCNSKLSSLYRVTRRFATVESVDVCEICNKYSVSLSEGGVINVEIGDFKTTYLWNISDEEVKEINNKILRVAKLYSKEELL